MKIIVLEVEDIKKRTLFNFHKKILSWVKNPIVLVLLWTTSDMNKKLEYMKIIESYFKDLGAMRVIFLEENDKNLDKIFREANILYIPGGDTNILLEKIKRNQEVVEKIRNFEGILIGNSAGAICLAKEGYGHIEGNLVKYEGLGIIDVKILVHFKWEDLEKIVADNLILLGENEYCIVFSP